MRAHKFDVIVVGAGGSGLMAALYATKNAQGSVAVISKLYPTRSHTGAAQGGVGAALGNVDEDHWEWHMFDTIKGGDYLTDQDAAEIFAKDVIDAVYELEHMGLPFSRLPDGKIAQRRFGGHTREFGKAPVHRACYAADRTGHMILQTLYQNSIKEGVNFFNEFLVLDLIMDEEPGGEKVCKGVVALDFATGELHTFHAKSVILATGGNGRMFKVTSNAHALTGDLTAIAYRRGIPLEDMEFYQFHPTGLYKLGVLLTEGVRGEGGILRNGSGERFMERYAPTIKDLAPRDIVSRSMYMEIREGRGAGPNKDYILLDITHLEPKIIEERLPDIADFSRTYLRVEPTKEPVPVNPTAHYTMGGIPTTIDGEVLWGTKNHEIVRGLYAAGEVACVSLHGANRLGTNSLGDLIVFGRRAGVAAAKFANENPLEPITDDADRRARDLVERTRNASGKESVAKIRAEMQQTMQDNASVFRTEETLSAQVEILRGLMARYNQIGISDRSERFNTELIEAIELGFLLDNAETLVHSALNRRESRGAHSREDYTERNDKDFLKHTMIYRVEPGKTEIKWRDVILGKYEPKARVY
jgi:succinate dehydrogenase / fumarate reductase, flavoprotein subunit